MDFAHGEPVSVLTAVSTPTGRYGEDLTVWEETETWPRCAIAPRPGLETAEPGRQGVIVGHTVYGPPGAHVGPHDRLRFRGDDHDIVGEPGVYVHPFSGWEPGIEVATVRVTG